MPDTFIKLHDGFPEHRKVVAVGGDAGWLHVCAMAYASRNLSDGRLPIGMVPRLSDRKTPTKLAALLVREGLWHSAGHDCPRCPQPGSDEYVIHDYLLHQRSAAKVEEIKEKRAASGRQGGTRKAANAKTRAVPKAKQPASNLLGGLPGTGQLSVVANGTPDTEVVLRTTHTEEPLRGSQAEAEKPPPAWGAVAPDAEVTARTIIGEWIDRCAKRPPDQVIGQMGREIKSLLDQHIDPDDIRRGVAQWLVKGKHPSTLPAFVNEVMNAQPQADARFAANSGSRAKLPTAAQIAKGKVNL